MQFQSFFLLQSFKLTVGYDLCACAHVCIWFSPTAPMRESCCVLNPMSYTPLCQCVTFSKMNDHNTIFIPLLYIHHSFFLSRQKEKDILLCTAFSLSFRKSKRKTFLWFYNLKQELLNKLNKLRLDSAGILWKEDWEIKNEELTWTMGWEFSDSDNFEFFSVSLQHKFQLSWVMPVYLLSLKK